jgi:chemotaxis protein MotB
MGGTAFDEEGARMPGTKPQVVMTVSTPAQPRSPEVEEREAKRAAEMNELMHEKSARDESNFQNAAESIRQSMRENPALAELSRNVIVDQTPEGLRIQIVDQDGRSMFPTGLAEPYERTRQLLDEVAKVLVRLPNRVSISGHTDANPLAGRPGYSNWELTADRANATRRILEQGGLSHDRIYQVVGKADSEPLFPEDPYMAANRRLSVVLLREAPVTPPGFSP